ncbi:MAG: hypothetical protein ACI3XM_08980, partial [Eubacteriales bacterium]
MYQQKVSLVLLSAMLCTILAAVPSCGGDGASDTEQTKAADTKTADEAVQTEEPDALEARRNVDDGLGNTDFGGKTFRIMGDDGYEDYYTQDGETGDVLDDAVYARNLAVSDRFNITLEATVFPEDQLITKLKSSVMAGDDEYQLFAGHIIYAGQAVCDSLYLNWYTVPHIDFTKPWWAPSTIEDLTYDGKAFIAIGDYALSAVDSAYCVYYNKQIASDYDLP